MVEDVVDFGAQLQSRPLLQPQSLEQPEIEVPITGAAEAVAPGHPRRERAEDRSPGDRVDVAPGLSPLRSMYWKRFAAPASAGVSEPLVSEAPTARMQTLLADFVQS